eukprot:1194950-Prorocentrum_minimum.AAC.4
MAHICSGLRFTSAPVSDRGALPHEPFRAAPRSLPPWYTLLASAPLVHTAPAPVSPSGSQSGRLTGEPCHTSPSAQPLGRSHLCHRRAPQSHIHLTCLHEPYRCPPAQPSNTHRTRHGLGRWKGTSRNRVVNRAQGPSDWAAGRTCLPRPRGDGRGPPGTGWLTGHKARATGQLEGPASRGLGEMEGDLPERGG